MFDPSRRRSLVPLAALAAACQPPLVEHTASQVDPPEQSGEPFVDDDPTETQTQSVAEVALDAVAPSYGTAGHEIRIDGGPFPADVVIRVGGAVAPIVDHRPDQLLVEVPDLGPTAWVEVTADGADGALPFRYFEDATGRIGALGAIEAFHFPGEYWADGMDMTQGLFTFTEPTDHDWIDLYFAPALEACATDYFLEDQVYVLPPEIPSVTLTDGAADLVLATDDDIPWGFRGAWWGFASWSALDLAPMTGRAGWPEFGVADFTAPIPDPVELVSPDIYSAVWPTVDPSFPVLWRGPFDGDLVLIEVTRMIHNPDGSFTALERLSCAVVDDGAFVVPDLWSDWVPGHNLMVEVGRVYRPAGAILPHNGGRSEVIGVGWSKGFVDTQ